LVELARKIKAVQEMTLKDGMLVCMDEIRIRVTGPMQMDIVVIDLPGIVNADEGRDETRELVAQYLKHPETLIMLVLEAKQDEQLASALDIARQYDPEGRRTMKVLTKCDVFDTDQARKRAINLVKSEHQPWRPSSSMYSSPSPGSTDQDDDDEGTLHLPRVNHIIST